MSTLEEALEEHGPVDMPPPSTIEHRTAGAALDELAALLTDAPTGSLAIVAGDEVSASGGIGELTALAEALGAPVYAAPLHSTGVFPPAHPLFAGMLPPAAAGIRAVLSPYQRVFFIGAQAFLVYPFSDGSPMPDGAELLHLSPDPGQLGRVHPVRLGVHGDPALTLAALLPVVRDRVDAGAAKDALEAARTRRAAEIERLEAAALDRYGLRPTDPMAAAHALVRALPDGAVVVDEAITTGVYVRGFHHWTEPGRYYFCKGGGLGWGMPASLGVSLAHDRSVPVLCAVGDGSAMYSPQSLWTAAPRASAGRVRRPRQPAVPDPQVEPAGYEGRDRPHRHVRRDGPRRSTHRLRGAGDIDGRARHPRRQCRRHRRRCACRAGVRVAAAARDPHFRTGMTMPFSGGLVVRSASSSRRVAPRR